MTIEDANCCLVGRRAEDRITLLSQELADGGRAALVFCETDAAETFRIVEGLGEEWEAIEGATDITELLGVCLATGWNTSAWTRRLRSPVATPKKSLGWLP